MKKCSKCELDKNESEYYKCKANKDGLHNQCKKCNDDVALARRRSPEGRLKKIYDTQVNVSKRRGDNPPNYTKKEFVEWGMAQPNYAELHSKWAKSEYDKMIIPSGDRLDDYKSYSLDNLRLISWGDNFNKYQDDRTNGVNNKQNLSVDKFTLSGVYVETYHSIREADRCNIKAYQTAIVRCCKGKQITSGGFRWKYSQENKELL